jgi:hypothetical protein
MKTVVGGIIAVAAGITAAGGAVGVAGVAGVEGGCCMRRWPGSMRRPRKSA